MELTNDLRIAPCGLGIGPASHAADRAVPDWGGLYARLSAAHALRREMTRESDPMRPCGSFSNWPAQGFGEPNGKQFVNLKDSTDRKGPWGIAGGSAGLVHAGDREQ